ncbi:protein kinase domain-containing protein [Microbulbifer halophilus]|uniref:protein kinase domain-containing protein n=1 Tax=Microbulbifer halophilus TaxID=453963 RepID=UPI003617FDF5
MTSEQLPFHIGRYQVTRRLGSGGMGVVYLATDEKLDREVAIKRLLKNPTSDAAPLRIRKEALLLAQLNHTNIVQIYDVVEEREDIALVMEYVEGCSLDNWQRERDPGLQQKILLLKQICNGLTRAHGIGIIHRDLKADNILVDDNNTAKITDFGIAKNWREYSDLTREQHIAGSWSAMSPEQALGKPLDNRCDLFALGVLAYRLLCGQGPFGDRESPFVIVDRVVNNTHPPAGKLNPELPADLCRLLDRLLAKDPDRRPLNATAVAAELDGILQHLDDGAGDTFSRTATITAEEYHRRRRRNRGRHRTLLGAVAGAGAALLVAAALALWPEAGPERRGDYIAVVSPHEGAFDSREEQRLASNMLSAIKQGLSNREGLLLVPYAESRQLRGQPLRDQARALNAQLLLHPTLNCEAAHCEASLEVIDTESFAATASRSVMLELGEDLDSRARILQQLNYLFPDNPAGERGAGFNISAEDYRRYLDLYERRGDEARTAETLKTLEALQKNSPGFPPYYELYSEQVIDHKLNTRSTGTLERLERFLQRAPRDIGDHPSVLTAKLRLAMSRDDPDRARALLEKLKLTLPDHASYHALRSNYYEGRGEYQKALAAIDRALALRTSTNYLWLKGLYLSQSGNMDAAKPYLLQVIEFSDHNSKALYLLAANELDSGRPAETIRLLKSVDVEQLGAMHAYNLCLAYYIENQFERAQQCMAGVAERAPGTPNRCSTRRKSPAHNSNRSEQKSSPGAPWKSPKAATTGEVCLRGRGSTRN